MSFQPSGSHQEPFHFQCGHLKISFASVKCRKPSANFLSVLSALTVGFQLLHKRPFHAHREAVPSHLQDPPISARTTCLLPEKLYRNILNTAGVLSNAPRVYREAWQNGTVWPSPPPGSAVVSGPLLWFVKRLRRGWTLFSTPSI